VAACSASCKWFAEIQSITVDSNNYFAFIKVRMASGLVAA
jgi:hypothetical protein